MRIRTLLFSLALFVCAVSKAGAGDRQVARPALRIDDQEISADEFAEWLIGNMGERQARVYALDDFVVEREARRLGLDVAAEDVARRVAAEFAERIRGAFFGRKSEWLAELARTGRTEAGVARQRETEMRPWMLAEKVAGVDRVVPEEKIEREWWLRHGRKGRKYDLAMIKFKVETVMPETHERDALKKQRDAAMESGRTRALAARARIVAGEDFGKVARELSDDPDTRDRRGDPSGGFRDTGWPKSFLEGLERLGPGELSEPLYGKGGFWLVYLRGVKVTPLESVRAEILADLVARGPEPDEAIAVQRRVQANVQVTVLPALWNPPREGERPAALEPAILVDGDPITRGAFARWLVDKEGEAAVPRFLEEWSVRRKARELGIALDDREVADRLREWVQIRIDEGFEGQRDAWNAFLAVSHRSEESFLREVEGRLRIDLLAEKMMLRERRVTPAEIEARFRDEFGEKGERIETSWIVLKIQTPTPKPGATRDELESAMLKASEAMRSRAAGLVERIRKGEDFAAIAREESEDEATRAAGGARPGRFRNDRFPDAIAAAVEALKPGEVSDPLLYGGVYAVFQVTARRVVKLDDVRAELENELRTLRPTSTDVASFRNTLVKPLKVEILPGLVER